MRWSSSNRAPPSAASGCCARKYDTRACVRSVEHGRRRVLERPLAGPDLEPRLAARVGDGRDELRPLFEQRLVDDDDHRLARLQPGGLDQVGAPPRVPHALDGWSHGRERYRRIDWTVRRLQEEQAAQPAQPRSPSAQSSIWSASGVRRGLRPPRGSPSSLPSAA